MVDAPPVRKEFHIRAPNAAQLELRLHWFGRALEARCGFIVHVERCQSGAEHVAAIAYEMPLPRYGRRTRKPSGTMLAADELVADGWAAGTSPAETSPADRWVGEAFAERRVVERQASEGRPASTSAVDAAQRWWV